MPRPICIPCRLEMRCSKNEQLVNDPACGDFPATYWSGDTYLCPKCGTAIVTGFGSSQSGPGPWEESLEFAHDVEQLELLEARAT